MNSPPSPDDQKRQAFAAARAGRLDEAEQLLKSVLTTDRRDIGALLLLGDVQFAANRRAESGASYRAALSLAAQQPAGVRQPFAQGLTRAQERTAESDPEHAAMIDRLLPAKDRSERFADSVDILLGRTPIYLQQPLKYYFPGLPQVAFYPRSDFAWAAGLEAKTDDIRRELLGVMRGAGAFEPYLPADASGKPGTRAHRLVGNPDWSAFYLWRNGARVEENCQLCPLTAEAVSNLPLDFLDGQAPSVLFSLLKPGAHIPPHHGLINTRLICHLPLLVPGPAWLRVGSKRHAWREGELVIFDDSIEHEAKNEASETRVVLLFDIWRPELTAREREEVSRLLGSIQLAAEGSLDP